MNCANYGLKLDKIKYSDNSEKKSNTQVLTLPLFASVLIDSTNAIAIKESRPLVGSSQNNKFGFVKSSQPNANRRLSPPLMPLRFFAGFPINVSSHFFKLS